MANTAIITAAGKGLRMKSSTKKQYMLLGGRPILCYSLDAFINSDLYDKVIITCPKKDVGFIKNLLFNTYDYDEEMISLIIGGKSRQDSVYMALSACPLTTSIVAIHDSVRPFVTVEDITTCHNIAKKYGAVILGHPVKNTIKKVKDNFILSTIERKNLWEIYTPQIFDFTLVKKAHEFAKENQISATDDAALVELLGHDVRIILGNPLNFKITDEFDLYLASLFMKEVK